MTRIVINGCLDYLRKQKRRRIECHRRIERGIRQRRWRSVTVNPTARLQRAELRQRIDPALANRPTSSAPSLCCVNRADGL